MAETADVLTTYKEEEKMEFLKIIVNFLKRMTNGRHYRNPVITEARIAVVLMGVRIASLRRAVYGFVVKSQQD